MTGFTIKEVKVGNVWHLDQVSDKLTLEDRQQILDSQVQLLTDQDKLVWTATTVGNFKLQSVLGLLQKPTNPLIWRKLIWDRRIPLKILVFMWLLINHMLPFPDVLQHFGFHLPSKCSFCASAETMNHFFIECQVASHVWGWFEQMLGLQTNAVDSLMEKLLGWWIYTSRNSIKAALAYLFPMLIYWELWKARNKVDYEEVILSPGHICCQVTWLLQGIGVAQPFISSSPDDEV